MIALSLLVMDIAKYFEHRAMHGVPWLWRIHRTHHSDSEMDVTTSLRFHPLESAGTLFADAAVIVAVGAPAPVVAWYRIAPASRECFRSWKRESFAEARRPAPLHR